MNAVTRIKNNAFSPFAELQRDLDRFFGASEGSAENRDWFSPSCDIEEGDQHYVLSLDVPGVRKEDIQVELRDSQLLVSGTRKREVRQEKGAMRFSERVFGQFSRSFSLPPNVDASKVEADYRDGVLKLVLPKSEAAKPRQIRIA